MPGNSVIAMATVKPQCILTRKLLGKYVHTDLLVVQLCLTLGLYGRLTWLSDWTEWTELDGSPPGSSGHGVLQARTLEWVAIPFSKGSSWARNLTQVSCIAGRLFSLGATREVPLIHNQTHFRHLTLLGKWVKWKPLSHVWLFAPP